MLDRVAKLLGGELTAATLVCAFFAHYARFDWAGAVVEDPLRKRTGRAHQRGAGEPMVVLGYHVPRVNVARAASVPAVGVVVEELRRASEVVARAGEGSGASWADVVGGDGAGAAEFLGAFKSYVRIDVQYWGSSSVKGRQLVGWVESRCPMLLVGKFA